MLLFPPNSVLRGVPDKLLYILILQINAYAYQMLVEVIYLYLLKISKFTYKAYVIFAFIVNCQET